MKYITFLWMILFHSTNSRQMNCYSYYRNMTRNMFLRLLIASNYKSHKNTTNMILNQYKQNISLLEENTKIKYFELSNKYYSLSNDDRIIIETIIDTLF
jgi:hypothetical protein